MWKVTKRSQVSPLWRGKEKRIRSKSTRCPVIQWQGPKTLQAPGQPRSQLSLRPGPRAGSRPHPRLSQRRMVQSGASPSTWIPHNWGKDRGGRGGGMSKETTHEPCFCKDSDQHWAAGVCWKPTWTSPALPFQLAFQLQLSEKTAFRRSMASPRLTQLASGPCSLAPPTYAPTRQWQGLTPSLLPAG